MSENYEDSELERLLKQRREKEYQENSQAETEKILAMMRSVVQLPRGTLKQAANELKECFNSDEGPFNLKHFENNEDEGIKAEFKEGQIEVKTEGNELKMEATGFKDQDEELAGVMAKGTKVILDTAKVEPEVTVDVSNAPNEGFQDTLKGSLENEEIKVLDSKQENQTEEESKENSASSENDSARTYKTPTLTPPVNPQG